MAIVSSTLASLGTAPVIRSIRRYITHKNSNPGERFGLIPFDSGSITVPSTSLQDDDALLLFKFPPNCRVAQLEATLTDMDTKATPELVFALALHDGSTQGTSLISGSTVGQGGGVCSAGSGLLSYDASEQYLAFCPSTSAGTAAAGTIRVRGLLLIDGRSGVSPANFQ